MNTKLSYNDKTVKFDSFASLFDYAFSKIDKFTKDDEFFLDGLFNHFKNNIKDKEFHPLKLNQELNSVLDSINRDYLKDLNKILIITYLESRCKEYLTELFFAKLK